MRVVVALLVALIAVGSASAATPRERSLQRQVKTLKQSNTRLTATVKTLRAERDSLQASRDSWLEEAKRLKALILNEVHALATAWRGDSNPKTDVSYFESGSNYWSYSFTWCGFC